jgi:hypothetical protein
LWLKQEFLDIERLAFDSQLDDGDQLDYVIFEILAKELVLIANLSKSPPKNQRLDRARETEIFAKLG